MTIENLLKNAAEILRNAGLENPRFEAEILLSKLLKINRAMLYAHHHDVLKEATVLEFQSKFERRAGHEPMAYIWGEKEFMGLTFKVSPDVLIPRPDTETIVEEALKRIPEDSTDCHVLDLCTGSGAIGLSIAHYRPKIKLTLTDISDAALKIAKDNANQFFPSARIVQGDLFSPVAEEKFQIIVSNPPYIPSEVIKSLESDVKDYEPRLALDGGKEGFDFYDRIIAEAKNHLYTDGWLLLEAGDHQGERLFEKLQAADFQNCFMSKDLIQMPRCIGGQKKAEND